MRSVAELEALVADLRARGKASTSAEEVAELRRQCRAAIAALSYARHPEVRRAAYERYRRRRYSGQQTAQAAYTNRVDPVQNPSTLRAPESTDGRCPKCGSGVLLRNCDGVGCICGFRAYTVARPLLLEVDEVMW